jgi:3-deoxy-D-manno-octulosonic acid kinase
MERIVRFGSTRILFDADAPEAPAAEWFDPDWWHARDAVTDELGGRGKALAIDTPAGPAVLRRYLRGGMMRHVNRDRYWFGGADTSRPFAEWRVTRRLHRAGLPVPEPLAAAFERDGPFYRAALLTRRIPDARPLPEVATRLQPDDWARIGATLARFAEAGLRHPDINATNLLVDDAGAPWLLDFDRARVVEGAFDAGPMLGRLQRSLAKLGIAYDAAALRRADGDW